MKWLRCEYSLLLNRLLHFLKILDIFFKANEADHRNDVRCYACKFKAPIHLKFYYKIISLKILKLSLYELRPFIPLYTLLLELIQHLWYKDSLCRMLRWQPQLQLHRYLIKFPFLILLTQTIIFFAFLISLIFLKGPICFLKITSFSSECWNWFFKLCKISPHQCMNSTIPNILTIPHNLGLCLSMINKSRIIEKMILCHSWFLYLLAN